MSKKPNAVKNEKCIAMDLEKGFVVTWDCSNGATSYKIVRKRVTKGKDVSEQTFTISSDEGRKGNKIIFNDKSDKISANSEYRYVITATNSYGSSISKTTNDAKPGTSPKGSITRIAADVGKTNDINLSWQSISRASLYYVYYQKNSSKTTLITKVSSTVVTLKRASIESGCVYIVPANGWGESKDVVSLWLSINGKAVSAYTR